MTTQNNDTDKKTQTQANNSTETAKKHQMKIYLTDEEAEILRQFAEDVEKPQATIFMEFVRESKLFPVLKRSSKAIRLIKKIKKSVAIKKDVIEVTTTE